MRKITFKAWDTERKRMFIPECITHDGVVFDNGRDFENYRPNTEAILLQCTGLQDKKGIPIYEGDVVRYRFNNDTREGAVEYDSRLLKYVIIRGNGNDFDTPNYMNEIEVVGNIYEKQNPQ